MIHESRKYRRQKERLDRELDQGMFMGYVLVVSAIMISVGLALFGNAL